MEEILIKMYLSKVQRRKFALDQNSVKTSPKKKSDKPEQKSTPQSLPGGIKNI